MKEQTIQKQIADYLTSLGGHSLVTIQISLSGEPDIVACLKGQFIGIEVKKPGEQPRPLQEHKLQLIRNAGGIAFSTTSVAEVQSHLSIPVEV